MGIWVISHLTYKKGEKLTKLTSHKSRLLASGEIKSWEDKSWLKL